MASLLKKKAVSKVSKMVGMSGRGESKYFHTTKKGEIHEYKEELHVTDESRRMDAVKKVIAAMTVGKDMSSLFPDVVQSMQTTNTELKKLVYLYIINYAKAQPELALLPINSFCKDTQDSNALIRALAVRTMGCIRLDQITEYLLEPLRRCCTDSDPYVRKTAAIAIPKVFEINPPLVEEQGFVPDILQDMLSDSNPMVVANAVASLTEISQTKGRDLLELDREGTMSKLLGALNECTEWGQVYILDAIASYAPKNKKDAEMIADRVTARLSHANPSVVMSAIKVCLTFMDHIQNPELIKTLTKKLTPPLVTLLSSECEQQYVALRNIHLIAHKRPQILTTDVKMFFCKYNDPVYVKLEKVQLMVMLCSERNCDQVLQEFKDYAQSSDIEFARRAVRSIGNVALKFETVSNKCIQVFLELIELKIPHVIQESVIVIKDIFRKYPSQYEQVLAALCENFDILDTTESKAAMIWILGDYAERIDKVEDILDSFLDDFKDESVVVQLQILTAIVKLFLKSPQVAQTMVTKVLKLATEDSDNPDLRDRGYIYWRLLHKNPEGTKRVVLGDKPQIVSEMQSLDKTILNTLVPQLSFMSSVYHKLPEEFITRVSLAAADDEDGEVDLLDDEDYGDKLNRMKKQIDEGPDLLGGGSSSEAKASGGGGGGDILDLLDMGGGGTPAAASSGAAAGGDAISKTITLPKNQNGQGGKAGLQIESCLQKKGGKIVMSMNLSNHNPGGNVSGFAIQLNKSVWGFTPAANLTELVQWNGAPNTSTEVDLPLTVGHAPLLASPTSAVNAQTLVLQVAIKTNLDVFYFQQPYDMKIFFDSDKSWVNRDGFLKMWQELGEAKQASRVYTFGKHQLDNQELMTNLCEGIHLFYVCKNNNSAYYICRYEKPHQKGDFFYGMLELMVHQSMVKINSRCTQENAGPALHATVAKQFDVTVKQ